MSRQIINNTPQDSGLGDSLYVATTKINAMTEELYAVDTSFSGIIDTINTTLATINDGSTLNHQHTIAQIIGLQTALDSKVSTTTFNTQIVAINASIQAINATLSDIIDILNTKIGDAPFSGITYGRRDGDWVPVSGGVSGDFLPLSGGTVFGPTIFTNGLTGNTMSATSYFSTGGYSVNDNAGNQSNWNAGYVDIYPSDGGIVTNFGGTIWFVGSGNDGITISPTNFYMQNFLGGTSYYFDSISVGQFPNINNTYLFPLKTGATYTGTFAMLDDITTFTGGTVNGLTATTISATTYLNLPIDVTITGGTYSAGTAVYTNNTGGTFSVTGFTYGDFVPYTGANKNVDLGVYGLATDYIQYNTGTTGTTAVGKMQWNETDGTVDLGLKGGNVTLQLGQEMVTRVVNKTGGDLLESQYKVVSITGATGQRLSVKLALADSEFISDRTLGVVTENILNNQEGFITTIGQVRSINTTGSLQGETWSDGDVLYLSPTVQGGLTNIQPTAPNFIITVGYVEYAHINHGKIFVKIDVSSGLDELHDVHISGMTDGELLTYSSTNSLWENKRSAYRYDVPSGYWQALAPYVTVVTNTSFGTSTTNSNNSTRFVPFNTDKKITIDEVMFFQTAANVSASNYALLYVYDDSNGGLPGLILSTGTTALGGLNVTNSPISFTNNFTLETGKYWFAIQLKSLDTAGVNPTFHFSTIGNYRGIQAVTPLHSNNHINLLTSNTTTLIDNPTVVHTASSTSAMPLIKIKLL